MVVPTSTSCAPDCSITSGTRKPPPISTLSPRLTTTCRSRASAASTSSTAAALLLTTIAASAPHSLASSVADGVLARSALAGARGRTRCSWPSAGGRSATGARPRLVCSSTPVALITGPAATGRSRWRASIAADGSKLAGPRRSPAGPVRRTPRGASPLALIDRASASTLGGRGGATIERSVATHRSGVAESQLCCPCRSFDSIPTCRFPPTPTPATPGSTCEPARTVSCRRAAAGC